MKIRLEESNDALITNYRTTPFYGAKYMQVIIEIEEGDNFLSHKKGDIIKVPGEVTTLDGKLTKSSEKSLNDWIKKNLK
jgi:hypothetical protein